MGIKSTKPQVIKQIPLTISEEDLQKITGWQHSAKHSMTQSLYNIQDQLKSESVIENKLYLSCCFDSQKKTIEVQSSQIFTQSNSERQEQYKLDADSEIKKQQQFNKSGQSQKQSSEIQSSQDFTQSNNEKQEYIKFITDSEIKKQQQSDQSQNFESQKQITQVQSSQVFKQSMYEEEYIKFETESEIKQQQLSNFNSKIQLQQSLSIHQINSLVQEMEKKNDKIVESRIQLSKIQSVQQNQFNNDENQKYFNSELFGFGCILDNINNENQEKSVEDTENFGLGFIIKPNNSEIKREQKTVDAQEESQSVLGTVQFGESPVLVVQKHIIDIFQSQIYSLLLKELQDQLIRLGSFKPSEHIIYEGTKFESKKLSDGSDYEGEMYNDKKHGFGYHYKNTKIYEGYFENDLRNGPGREVSQNGDFINGYWKDDYIEGNVEFKKKEQHFIGFCKKHMIPQGQGYLENKEFKYQGNFLNGKQNGKGRKFTFADQTEYSGELENDRMQGFGELRFRDKVYIGNFFNNKFEGQGCLTWADGREYKGMFKNNFRHGIGQMRDLDGKLYQGEWVEDEFNFEE